MRAGLLLVYDKGNTFAGFKHVKAYKVPVKIFPFEHGGYKAEAPALQGCWVVAETLPQALADIQEGIEMHIASRLKWGEPIPPEIAVVNEENFALLIDLPIVGA